LKETVGKPSRGRSNIQGDQSLNIYADPVQGRRQLASGTADVRGRRRRYLDVRFPGHKFGLLIDTHPCNADSAGQDQTRRFFTAGSQAPGD
jgi:hypothetical protein